MSLYHAFFSMVILVTATIFSQVDNKNLSKKTPQVLSQFGLTGLLPLSGLKMPFYPLLYVNIVLFVMMSTVNMLFMVKSSG